MQTKNCGTDMYYGKRNNESEACGIPTLQDWLINHHSNTVDKSLND